MKMDAVSVSGSPSRHPSKPRSHICAVDMIVEIVGTWTEKHTAAMVALGHQIADALDEQDKQREATKSLAPAYEDTEEGA